MDGNPATERTAAGRLRPVAMYLGIAILGTVLAITRLPVAPGVDLYLAPILYLLVYRAFGLRLGLIAAIIVMLPSYFFGGQNLAVVAALAHLLFLRAFVKRSGRLAIPTLLFQLALGIIIGLYFFLDDDSSNALSFSVFFTKQLLNEVLLAAIVDLVAVLTVVDRTTYLPRVRQTFSFFKLLSTSTALMMWMAIAFSYFIGISNFTVVLNHQLEYAALHVQTDPQVREGGQPYFQTVESPDVGRYDIYVDPGQHDRIETATLERLGCASVNNGERLSWPKSRQSFEHWVHSCRLFDARFFKTPMTVVVPTRKFTERAFVETLFQLAGLLVIIPALLLMRMWVGVAIRSAARTWEEIVYSPSRALVVETNTLAFEELARPVARFIDARNRFVVLAEDKARLVRGFRDLKRSIEFTVLSGIAYDAANGILSFDAVHVDAPPVAQSLAVHVNDRFTIESVSPENDILLELRLGIDRQHGWYILMADDAVSPFRWASGLLVRLREPKVSIDLMRHRARLVELGAMASALSHELRQPLATISLAAGNGSFQLDRDFGDDAAMIKSKFTNIQAQVERASKIIAQISRYGHAEDRQSEPVDVEQTISKVVQFLRPLLVQGNVRVEVRGLAGSLACVMIARIKFEQLLANIIGNAIDSIVSRRPDEIGEFGGRILITLAWSGRNIEICVIDNGLGLDIKNVDIAFDAFFTTKSPSERAGLGLYLARDILTEIGGAISISPQALPKQGALVRMIVPAL